MIKSKRRMSTQDKKTINEFSSYVLKVFGINPTALDITISFLHSTAFDDPAIRKDFERYQAWMYQISKTKYEIEIHVGAIGTGKDKLKNALTYIGHELVHIKQYYRGELKDLENGNVRWKNKNYKYSFKDQFKDLKAYYFSPWEREAYGYQEGLYETFVASKAK